MDDAPPPTYHTLKPHHIDLLAILRLLFKEYETKLPSTFTLHVYRVLLNGVSEVSSSTNIIYSGRWITPATRSQNQNHIQNFFMTCTLGQELRIQSLGR